MLPHHHFVAIIVSGIAIISLAPLSSALVHGCFIAVLVALPLLLPFSASFCHCHHQFYLSTAAILSPSYVTVILPPLPLFHHLCHFVISIVLIADVIIISVIANSSFHHFHCQCFIVVISMIASLTFQHIISSFLSLSYPSSCPSSSQS